MADNPFREDITIYPTMVALAACLELELEASGLPETPMRGLAPGLGVPFDFSEDGCGQSWVQLIAVNPSVQFPLPEQVAIGVSKHLALVVEVGVIRCVEGLAGDGTPPDMATQLAVTRLQLADMAAIKRAICACLQTQDRDFVLGAYAPYGEGGVVGGAWTVTIRFPGNG